MKNERGSVSAIVIYSVLIIIIILVSILMTFSMKSKTQIIEMDKLRNVYDGDMNTAYADYMSTKGEQGSSGMRNLSPKSMSKSMSKSMTTNGVEIITPAKTDMEIEEITYTSNDSNGTYTILDPTIDDSVRVNFDFELNTIWSSVMYVVKLKNTSSTESYYYDHTSPAITEINNLTEATDDYSNIDISYEVYGPKESTDSEQGDVILPGQTVNIGIRFIYKSSTWDNSPDLNKKLNANFNFIWKS